MQKFLVAFLIFSALLFGFFQIKSYVLVPDFPLTKTKLKDENGISKSLEKPTGKYRLVAFFKTWCGDCVREIPHIEVLQKNAGKQKLEVLFISDEPLAKIQLFKNKFNPNAAFYQSEMSFKSLGIKVFPTTYLLDEKNKIIASKMGGFDWNSKEITDLIP